MAVKTSETGRSTRGKEKEKEKENEKAALLSAVFHDLVQDQRFLDLVNIHLEKCLADLKETVEKQEGRIFDLEVAVDNKSK